MKASTLQLMATILYATSGICTAFFLWPFGLIISALWVVGTVLSILNYKNKRLDESASSLTQQSKGDNK